MSEIHKVLNVRDVPEDLLWSVREAAAKLRITMRQFVLDALQEKLDRLQGDRR